MSYQAKQRTAGGRQSIIAGSSMAYCEFYAVGRGGVTCPVATANGRVSMNAFIWE